MKIRRFFGRDMREALSLVKEELGQDAVIMSNRKVSDGVELVAAYDKEPTPAMKATPNPKTATSNTKNSKKPVPTLSEIIGDHGPDNLKALLEQQAQAKLTDTPPHAIQEPNVRAAHVPSQQSYTQASGAASGSVSNSWDDEKTTEDSNSLSFIKDELATLRQVLQHQVADLFDAKKQRQKPIHGFIRKQLSELGLSFSLAEQLSDFVPADATERDAWRYVLQLMVNRLSTGGDDLLSQTGAVALLGPTGTGKTTTVAKLAARYAKKYGSESVALVTIDTYRIGAFEQLQTFGKIIGCTVKKAENAQVLSDVLFQLRHKRMIFIDTAGFSQRDERLVQQIEQLSNSSVAVKRYLVLQANTQYPALSQATQAYDSNNIDGCILTKMDECFSLGEALSVAIEHQLPLSFVTDGQQVPEDIRRADAKSLVSIAAKLYKNYGMNHTNEHNQSSKIRAI